MFNQIGPLEVVVVLAVVLLIFGPKRLPGAGRALGKSMREFKESISGDHKDDREIEPPEVKADSQDTNGQPPEQRDAEPSRSESGSSGGSA
ncbi:MAG: twin-arginine translocase TatA/TatE family subunit [Actinomycetes bacterium]